jgi:hypothetical protein
MKKVLCFLVFATTIVSCKKNVLEFNAFTITNGHAETGLIVDADGTVNEGKDDQVTLGRDGVIKDKEGKEIARLKENNELVDENGKKIAEIDKDGTIKKDSTVLRWTDKGELMSDLNTSYGLYIEPADKKSYQAASTIMCYYLNTVK